MSKYIDFFRDQPKSFIYLTALVVGLVAVGMFSSFLVGLYTLVVGEFYLRPFCFSNSCLKSFFEDTSQAYLIARVSVELAVAVSTIGGIFVALLSYFSGVGNSALTNHIEHLKIFMEYLSSEISKRDRLSDQCVDVLYFYSVIFNQSRYGKTTVSDEYRKIIDGLNQIIHDSNLKCKVGAPGGFNYRSHQTRVRDHLARAGIVVYNSPRNDYFEMEGQMFSLLNRVSQSFCSPGSLPNIIAREYI